MVKEYCSSRVAGELGQGGYQCFTQSGLSIFSAVCTF